MAIPAFNNVADGLGQNSRQHGQFIANTDIDDKCKWVPCVKGVWFQPCIFNLTSGAYGLLLKALPGAKPGTIICESAGETHTLVAPDESPGLVVMFFMIDAALIYLDKPTDGIIGCVRRCIQRFRPLSQALRRSGVGRARARCADSVANSAWQPNISIQRSLRPPLIANVDDAYR